MSDRFRAIPPLLVLMLFATAVADSAAQTPPTPVPPGRLSVSGTTGLAASMMTSGAALGGNVAFEASDRLTVEGRALWLQRGGGGDGPRSQRGASGYPLSEPRRRPVRRDRGRPVSCAI